MSRCSSEVKREQARNLLPGQFITIVIVRTCRSSSYNVLQFHPHFSRASSSDMKKEHSLGPCGSIEENSKKRKGEQFSSMKSVMFRLKYKLNFYASSRKNSFLALAVIFR